MTSKNKKNIQKPKSTRNQKSFQVWILILGNLKAQKHLSGTLFTTLKHWTPRSIFISLILNFFLFFEVFSFELKF